MTTPVMIIYLSHVGVLNVIALQFDKQTALLLLWPLLYFTNPLLATGAAPASSAYTSPAAAPPLPPLPPLPPVTGLCVMRTL